LACFDEKAQEVVGITNMIASRVLELRVVANAADEVRGL
jgi:hypothetical protein